MLSYFHLHGMGAGNRSQGKMYWRKAVEYKLANKAKANVIDSRRHSQ